MDHDPVPMAFELELVGNELGCEVSHVARIEGGQSATTDILECGDGTRVVLRRHGRWSTGFDEGVADRESLVMDSVSGAGVSVPEVLWSGAIEDRPAMVTRFVEGNAILDPRDGSRWAGQLAAILAMIHATRVDEGVEHAMGSAPVGPGETVPAPQDDDQPSIRRLRALRAELQPASLEVPSLIHGDFWPGNVLWRGDEIVAVVDWEAARLGDPAADVAYCATEMRFLGREPDAETFVAAYRSRTGSDLASLDFWTITALLRGLEDPGSFIVAWRGLGHREDPGVLVRRQQDLIARLVNQA